MELSKTMHPLKWRTAPPLNRSCTPFRVSIKTTVLCQYAKPCKRCVCRVFLYFQRFSKIPGFTPNYPRCAGCSKKMWAKIPPPACLISSKFHLSTTLNSMQGTFLGTPLHKTTSSNQHTKNPALHHHKSSESHHQIPRVDLH